jgi:VIT1/CCC1 family predicted Fe2+/Mn2+ transporter
LSFEIQELPDVIAIIVLLNLGRDQSSGIPSLKRRIDKICAGHAHVEMNDLNEALKEMESERLIAINDGAVQLTERGARLGKEWRMLLLKKEPIIEVVAGLADGSVTGLVVVLSAFIAGLAASAATFAAFLTLTSVSITNFSSFMLGGITEDLSDMLNLRTLMDYSLSDNPDKSERDKSLALLGHLFRVLHKEISKSNLQAATICGTTTFAAGSMPIVAYLTLPSPLDIVLSLCLVATIVGVFLVRYRSKKTLVHWKVTLFETIVIVTIAVIASVLLGRGI